MNAQSSVKLDFDKQVEERKAAVDNKCVQCGYCCTKSACPYGLIDDAKQACIFLSEPNSIGQRKCMLYDLIKKHVSDWHLRPAFEAGCPNTLFNSSRDKIINIITERRVLTSKLNFECKSVQN